MAPSNKFTSGTLIYDSKVSARKGLSFSTYLHIEITSKL